MTINTLERAAYTLLSTIETTYAGKAPQDADTPFIVYRAITRDGWDSLDGPSGMAQKSIQVDSYAIGSDDAKQLAGQVRQLLNGYGGTVSSVRIDSCRLLSETDLSELETDPKLERVSQDFLFTFQED